MTTLPVRQYGENSNGTYYKVNEQFNVVHCVRGDRLCCLDCRSNECEHTRAVERAIKSDTLNVIPNPFTKHPAEEAA